MTTSQGSLVGSAIAKGRAVSVALWRWVRLFFHRRKNCQWQHWMDPGEEEHGMNFSRRRCKICGRVQHRFHHRYGNIRCSWHDEPNIPVSNAHTNTKNHSDHE